jgi:hypothetical protein
MRLHFRCLALCLLSVSALSQAQVKRALLVGINTYQPANTNAIHPAGCSGGRCDLPAYPNLDGAVNDVSAMRDLLASPKFGFEPKDVVVLTNPALPTSGRPFTTLPPSDTGHDGILASVRKYLVDTPAKGDMVVFYYAGHGSLRLNLKGTKLKIMVNGKMVPVDSTVVPSDAWMGKDDIRDREMTRIFYDALEKGVNLTIILDSCHSGALTRGVPLGHPARERLLAYDPRPLDDGPDLLPNGQVRPAPAEHPKNPALVFSAAQQDQTAKESPPPDTVSQPHGAFTAALIGALESLPTDAPASVVYQEVMAEMEGAGVPDQTPSLDAGAARRGQPLFGGAANKSDKLHSAAIRTTGDGLIVLDAGKLAGVGVGSTFTRKDAKGRLVLIKVKELDGIARSRAALLSPPGATVHTGEIFELDKWVPPPFDPLLVWMWPSNLSLTDVQAAIDALKASGVVTVEDPAEQPWTELFSWDGSSWILQHAGSSDVIKLGAQLNPTGLKALLSANARLWINLPPPRELGAQLELDNSAKMVSRAQDISDAEYVLAGTLSVEGPQWSWFHRIEFQQGPRPSGYPNHSLGCSATSHYPVRTDWVLLTDPTVLADASAQLNKLALRLAKLHDWMTLPSSPGGASDYYRLAFQPEVGGPLLEEGQAVRAGTVLEPVLVAASRVMEQRFVYILDVDCTGKGILLYPRDLTDNRFPNNATHELQIPIDSAPKITVQEPYGLDSVFLISTSDPLPNPWALEFEGVTTRGIPEGAPAETPLQQLLGNASSGTRGLTPVMPTNWSITRGALRSVDASPN